MITTASTTARQILNKSHLVTIHGQEVPQFVTATVYETETEFTFATDFQPTVTFRSDNSSSFTLTILDWMAS